MATIEEINDPAREIGVRVWSERGDFCALGEDGDDRIFFTAEALYRYLEKRRDAHRSDLYEDLLKAAAITEQSEEHLLIVRPNGRVIPIAIADRLPNWDHREQDPQRIIENAEVTPQPISVEVVTQQAKDVGALFVDRDDTVKEVYTRRYGQTDCGAQDRATFRTLEEASAFLKGIAQRKAQFG